VRSRAPRVYIANLMTQPGETTHYTLSQHLRAIENMSGNASSIMWWQTDIRAVDHDGLPRPPLR